MNMSVVMYQQTMGSLLCVCVRVCIHARVCACMCACVGTSGGCVTVIFCGVPVWCCFASAATVWTVGVCTLLGYHYVAYLDLGQELSGDN